MNMSDNKATERIAIVGGGVSGLSAAWHLKENSNYDVELFESEDRLGGHAHTMNNIEGVDVDIGFMVFNSGPGCNYPNLTHWFQQLQVKEEQSDMSLSVSLDGGKTIEWNSDGFNGLFAKRTQLFTPAFFTFISDMIRFNSQASSILHLNPNDPRRVITIGQYLRDHSYSQAFSTYYLLPMIAAIWSASIQDVLQFPAAQLVAFMCNHKMLQIFDRPTWKTVSGRSQTYVHKVQEILGQDNIHLKTPIQSIQQVVNGKKSYQLFTNDGKSVGIFDQVIFACHPPTTKQILANNNNHHTGDDQAPPSPNDNIFCDAKLLELLDKIEYADNAVYLHSDPSLMPRRRRAWASWNCIGKSNLISSTLPKSNHKKGESFEGGESGFGASTTSQHEQQEQQQLEGEEGRMKAVYVTYWLNRLQNLKTDKNIFVSLNPHQKPDPSLTHERFVLAHPQFNPSTLEAREILEKEYQGRDGLWFCGAWQGYGFHEDGCRSGFQVACDISGVSLPWATATATSSIENGNGGQQTLMVLPPPDLSQSKPKSNPIMSMLNSIHKTLTYHWPVAICKRFVTYFLNKAIQKGQLLLKFNDGSIISFGDGTLCGCDASPVTIRVFDPWFFVKTALEYDLGLARSYMAGHFVIEKLDDVKKYDPIIRPLNQQRDESNTVLGDPVGLLRLFMLLIGNRDRPELFEPRKAAANNYTNAMTNASGLIISKIGSLLNYLRYKLTMDNSERGGSLKNIHAHYDLSNDLFTTFLDKETLMYSSAIYDAVKAPHGHPSGGGGGGLVFRGSLEEAQWRKLDTLLNRAQVEQGMSLLDIGFGWGGLSLYAAKKYGCRVTGITLSVEQKALAEKRVEKEGLQDLIRFEVCDYRKFARRKENRGKFDRVISCEMIEAVGHDHLGEFFWAVEQVLSPSGILVMEAITTPEQRYETYRKSTDFINTIIFPGGCAPSLHALLDAAYKNSCLTLEHIDNIGLHYARTLAEWRRRFNAQEAYVRSLGFDDVFLRVWNYYMTYCEAGFYSQTENCLILVFSRQGCKSLMPLCESRVVTQAPAFTNEEINEWLNE